MLFYRLSVFDDTWLNSIKASPDINQH